MSFQDFSDLASLAELHSGRCSSGPVLFSSNHSDSEPLCKPLEHSQNRTCWGKGGAQARCSLFSGFREVNRPSVLFITFREEVHLKQRRD